jgi:hypothetical protein
MGESEKSSKRGVNSTNLQSTFHSWNDQDQKLLGTDTSSLAARLYIEL